MAQTLYMNGTILTMNEAQPEAGAVLVEDGVIRAVGDLDAVRAAAEAFEKVFDPLD